MKKDKFELKDSILKEIFRIAPKRIKVTDIGEQALAKKLNVSFIDLKKTLEFLFNLRFIRKTLGDSYKENRIFEWEIMEEGLYYLEDREKEKRQEINNRIIAFTGGIIALTTIYSFIVQSINLKNYPQTYWIITPIFLALILFCLGPLIKFIVDYWKSEVFEK